MPERMADASEMKTSSAQFAQQSSDILPSMTGPHEFIMLQNAVCSRVTLFIAHKRGVTPI